MILFELNTRLCHARLERIADEHLARLAALGFDWIWLMGLWRIGPAAIAISRRYEPDYEGSPYAIAEYSVSPELGGEEALRHFVDRAHAAGLRVMADFVPNHMAVDSPLVDAHPELVIHSNPALRDEHPADSFDHPRGRLAHGKDPYFAGWTDTVQLDYAHPALRAHQCEVLKRIAAQVDGVRCDMAMLVLRDQVKNQWFPRVDQALFDQHFPREFWSDAIEAARSVRPDFVFMAEVYWDKEPYLQHLGFDFTYDKKLYDMLAHHHHPWDVANYLRHAPAEYVRRSVHFLENHDEERAAARFGGRARPAAILSFAIPGAPFVHQGQMEGFTEKLPVQRLRPLRKEEPDEVLARFYARLLAIVKEPLYRDGEMDVLGVQHDVILLVRRREGRAALVGANPTGHRHEQSPAIEVPIDRLGGAAGRCVDRWSGERVETRAEGGLLRIAEGAIASWPENHGFLLEIG